MHHSVKNLHADVLFIQGLDIVNIIMFFLSKQKKDLSEKKHYSNKKLKEINR